MVAVPMDVCLVVFLAVKDGEQLIAAVTRFLKTCSSKDTADAICTFRFYHPNLTHDICRDSDSVEGSVFGLCGMPETW